MIVIVDVPVVAVLLAVKVKTLVEVVGLVPNEAVTPEGRAEFESVTLPVNPPLGVTVIVEEPLLPCVTLKLLGEADSEKLGVAVAFTVRETEVVCDNVPDVPVIVTDFVPVVAVLLALKVTTLLPVVGFVPNVAVTPASCKAIQFVDRNCACAAASLRYSQAAGRSRQGIVRSRRGRERDAIIRGVGEFQLDHV